MAHARPEYAIIVAIAGVLLAIGIPSLKREQFVVGGLCIGAAVAIVGYSVLAIRRSRE